MRLSLKIIREFGFNEKTYKPDHDDVSVDFTLTNGIVLSTMTMCNNEAVESNSLEGMDGYIYITTKEELEELNALSYEDALQKIALEYKEFKIEDYL